MLCTTPFDSLCCAVVHAELEVYPLEIARNLTNVLFARRLDFDADVAGAATVLMALACVVSLGGRSNFGTVLGWSLIHSLALHVLLRLACAIRTPLHTCWSVLGYCMLPVLAHACLMAALPSMAPWRCLSAALVCSAWAATRAATMLTASRGETWWFMVYPCTLTYSLFSLLGMSCVNNV